MPIKILGAGLSGLSSAINLAKDGKEVEVFEKKDAVGKHIRPNYQGLLRTHNDPMGYLKRFSLEPEFDLLRLSKAYICTRKRDLDVTLKEPIDFVLRGGENSLEHGLYEQARALEVKFHFNEKRSESEMNIVATGHYRTDMIAYGCVYEDLDLPRDKFLYMHDDRFSPIGWYFYITPLPNGEFKAVNCCSQPHVKQAKKLYYKALKERKIVRDIIGDRKPIDSFGGFGGCNFPKSAKKGRVLYVGEAAGFQDPFRGFGMNFAIESGYLAARAIIENKDYDKLWKKHFKRRIKTDLYRRYALVAFGDKAIEHVFRHTHDGDEIDFVRVNPSGFKGATLREVFYRLELLRHWRTGYW